MAAEFGAIENDNEKLFFAVKNTLKKVKDRFQKTTSNEDQDAATEEQKISEELINLGEERKQERLPAKSKLVSVVEADTKMRERMDQHMERSMQLMENSNKRLDRLMDLMEAYIQVKKQKLENKQN